jgi:hypothetical protein
MNTITIVVMVKIIVHVMPPRSADAAKKRSSKARAREAAMPRHFIIPIADIKYRFINFRNVTV